MPKNVTIKDIAAELSADAIDEARSEDSELVFKPKDLFDKEKFMKLSTALSNAIENCGYPHFTVAALSPDSFDVVVNGNDTFDVYAVVAGVSIGGSAAGIGVIDGASFAHEIRQEENMVLTQFAFVDGRLLFGIFVCL